jgi:hypothetical protein
LVLRIFTLQFPIVAKSSPKRHPVVTILREVNMRTSGVRLNVNGTTGNTGTSATSDPASDLSAWLDETALIKLALEAIQGVVPNFPGDNFQCEGRGYRPQILMLLVIYCYATGLYDSGEIEASLEHDPALRYICAGTRPDAYAVQRFRHAHRDLIVQILARLVERAWELRGGADSASGIRPDFHGNAAQRIEQALFLDCIARDV